MPTAILWLPAVAVAAHLVEEFVWPGGFAAWYRHYPPGAQVTVTTRSLVIINAVLVVLVLLPLLLGPTDRGFAFWIVAAAIAAVNAIFHLTATVRTRGYAPGVVTSVIAYLPLAAGGGAWLLRNRLVTPGTVAQAIVVAGVYQVWSTWNHRRHVVPRGAV